ncbi:hypothetical protein BDV12DRAFT_197459 [Aspergillus spectabilis]
MSTNAESKVACVVCRSRKVACDRRRPKCGMCEKNGFDCQYKPREHQPGLRAGYVSKLESRLVQLEKRMDDFVSRCPPGLSPGNMSADVMFPMTAPTRGNIERDDTGPPSTNLDLHLNRQMENDGTTKSLSENSIEHLNHELHTLWLQRYQQWFPILHHTSVSNAFSGNLLEQALVQKAIMAVTIWDIPVMLFEQRQFHSERLQKEVIPSAMTSMSLRSIQSLLILAILFWGEAKWIEYSNLIAMCRRMSQQLRLTTVAGVNRDRPLEASLGSVATFAISKDIDNEEQLRTYWMIETLDSVFALNVGSSISAPPTPLTPKFPCSDAIWASPDLYGREMPSYDGRHGSGFSLCIYLCISELKAVHRFQQAARQSSNTPGGLGSQDDAQMQHERLTIWHKEFAAAVVLLINAQNPRSEMEPFIVLTSCFFNMAVISLLQSHSSLPAGVRAESETWPYANQHCIYACEDMVAKVHRMKDSELKSCNPCLVLAIFVAARFFIVHTKGRRADVPVNLHSLSYSLYACGHRWPLAKMYDAVIRTAVAEHRTPVLESVLPHEFYDLRTSAVDISPSLQRWADQSSTRIPSDV